MPYPRALRALTALLGLFCLPAVLASPRVEAPHVVAELLSEDRHLVPGGQQWLGVRLSPEPGWHVYWQNPGDSGLPTRIEWTLPDGLAAGEIHWPYPHAEPMGPLTNYGYSDPTLHLVPLDTTDTLAGPVTLEAQVSWLVCSDVCIPGKATLRRTLDVAPDTSAEVTVAPLFAEARAQLPQPWPGAPGVHEIVDGEFRLSLEAPWQPGQRLEWFALQNDLVDHAAPQRLSITSSELRLAQHLSPYFVEAETPVRGVLVVHTPGAPVQAYALDLPVGEVAAVPIASPSSEGRGPGLVAVLAFAFLGGLILNLMPCVFPVLSLKALSVLRSQDQGVAHRQRHALIYTAGVVASCLLIAAALLGLRAGGEAVGWGFQLQSPVFVGVLAYVMFALGLSLSGFVHFGTGLMGLGQSLTQGQGASSSFFTGVLAVVVASPCTAPFMGTALGYALTQPPATALLIFAALGIGLASPFLLIGFVPAVARWLPKPGLWMERFKQFMAFPLYLTAIWLIWVAGRQTSPESMALLLIGAVLIAFAFWLIQRPGGLRRLVAATAVAAALALLAQPALQATPQQRAAAPGHDVWSDERFETLRAQGRTIFVDFTADWCISCKVNERVALQNPRVQAAFAEHNVAFLVGDWTRADPAITAVLDRYGRSGVPLYLVSKHGEPPVVLPQLLTPDIVISAITP